MSVGKVNVEFLGAGQFEPFELSGLKDGKLKMPKVVNFKGGDLIKFGESEVYVHCISSEDGQYYGIYKSPEENHIYQHILKENETN